MKEYLIVYLAFITVVSAAVCVSDKRRAIKRKRRIRERTLWIFSALGGSAGMYLTMRLIRHKTKHASFMLGLPALIVFQVFLCLLLTKLF